MALVAAHRNAESGGDSVALGIGLLSPAWTSVATSTSGGKSALNRSNEHGVKQF